MIEFFKRTEDDWADNYKVLDYRWQDVVFVKLYQQYDSKHWRIVVSGDDDFSLSYEFATYLVAYETLEGILKKEFLNIDYLKSLGFACN